MLKEIIQGLGRETTEPEIDRPNQLILAGSNGKRQEYLESLGLEIKHSPLGKEPQNIPETVALWKVYEVKSPHAIAVDTQQKVNGVYLTKPKNPRQILDNILALAETGEYTTESATVLKLDGEVAETAVNKVSIQLNKEVCKQIVGNRHLFTHFYLSEESNLDPEDIAGGLALEIFLGLGAVEKIEINGEKIDFNNQEELSQALHFVTVGIDPYLAQRIAPFSNIPPENRRVSKLPGGKSQITDNRLCYRFSSPIGLLVESNSVTAGAKKFLGKD